MTFLISVVAIASIFCCVVSRSSKYTTTGRLREERKAVASGLGGLVVTNQRTTICGPCVTGIAGMIVLSRCARSK